MDLLKHRYFQFVAIMGIFCFTMIFFVTETAATKTISLTETQKSTLATAVAWKVNIRHDYGKAEKYKGIPIEKDIAQIFQYAGWQIRPTDASAYDALFEIAITGKPQGCSYTTGYHYTAAEIKIEAVIAEPKKMWELKFDPSSARDSCSFFISGSYKEPERAPFNAAYRKNKGFFKQLFAVIYQSKGIEALSIAMKDASLNMDIRNYIQDFAGETGDKRFSILLLVNMTSENGSGKKAAITALGQLGDPKAIPSLSIALLEDKNAGVRAEAAQALGRIGDKQVAAVLAKALQEDQNKEVRHKAAQALKQLSWQPQSVKERVLYSLAQKKNKEIINLGKQALPVIIELLDHKDSEIRKESALILGEFKSATAAEALARRLAEDKVSSVRVQAAKALGLIGDPGSISSLSIALLEDKDRNVRAEAVQALGKTGDSKVTNVIAKALMEDNDKTVRKQAAQALKQLSWQPQSVKEKVLYYLALKKKKDILKMGKEALPVLIGALDSPDWNIREDSVEILGELGYAEAVEPLCRRLAEDKAFKVRSKAINALGAIGDPKAIPSLSIALLEDKNSTIRTDAARMLGKIGDPKAVDVLGKALMEDKDKTVRKNTIEALKNIGNKKAIPYLKRQLKKETDETVKKAINYALMGLGADVVIPLEIRIEKFKQTKDWTKLKLFLKEQKTPVLIEQLRTKDSLIKKMVAETLMERTGKFELGTDYTAWRKWYEKTKQD